MKTFYKVLIVLSLLVSTMGFTPKPNTCMPPALPSSFYGTITNARVNQTVAVFDGYTKVASTQTYKVEGYGVVYSLDVKADDTCTTKLDGGREGDKLSFKLNGIVIGNSIWHGGTNTALNLKTK